MSASPGAASGRRRPRSCSQRLIRFNTVNPPGNERAAQEYLAEHLSSAGFECELLGAEPERPTSSRAPPRRRAPPGPTLCYLGHVDTVLADPAEWTHDPWSGRRRRRLHVGPRRAGHEVPGGRGGGGGRVARALGLAPGRAASC